MRGRSRFKPNRYRAEKTRALERRAEHLDAELRRHRLLLGDALEIAVAHTSVDRWALLDVIADSRGMNLAKPAWVEARERERRERPHELVHELVEEGRRRGGFAAAWELLGATDAFLGGDKGPLRAIVRAVEGGDGVAA
jgi:hypothetical protein